MGGSILGGGGGGGSSTTTNLAPGNLGPYAGVYLKDLYNTVNNDLTQGPNPNLYTQVAGFNPYQTQGLNFTGQTLPGLYNSTAGNLGPLYGQAYGALTGALNQGQTYLPAAQQSANVGANQLQTFARGGNQSAANPTLQAFANGQFAGPNPILSQYFNSQAAPLISNYQLGTEPALMAQFQQAGAFNSPGFDQAQGLAQQGLGQSLASLGTGIAVPAYEQGMNNMLSAGQSLQQNTQFNTGNRLAAAEGLGPASAAQLGPAGALSGLAGQTYNNLYGLGSGISSSLYGAANQTGQGLYNAGAGFQQQQQNINNALQSNAGLSTNWPFALLGQLGAGLGTAGMGQGQTISQYQPSNGGGGGIGNLFGLL